MHFIFKHIYLHIYILTHLSNIFIVKASANEIQLLENDAVKAYIDI
jgi:hypothetical protein